MPSQRMQAEILCATPVYGASRPTDGQRALLIFADARSLDLQRRGFAVEFGALFQNLSSVAKLAPDADRHLFTTPDFLPHLALRGGRSPALPDSVAVHPQRGSTFAEKLEAAVEEIARLGYREVVVIGADCPELDAADVATAFAQLGGHSLVLGPDQRGGCYLIGLRLEERALLRGIRWQRDEDCRQLAQNFGPARTFLLPVKLDLDTLADVRLLARGAGRFAALAGALLRALDDAASRLAMPPVYFARALHRLRARWQLPPPAGGTL